MKKQSRVRTEAEIAADKSRPGRPPMRPTNRQSERVTVRMTPAVRRKLERLAKVEGVSLAEIIMRPWNEEEGL
jgi:predicted HicB family RNase H-like nuclease